MRISAGLRTAGVLLKPMPPFSKFGIKEQYSANQGLADASQTLDNLQRLQKIQLPQPKRARSRHFPHSSVGHQAACSDTGIGSKASRVDWRQRQHYVPPHRTAAPLTRGLHCCQQISFSKKRVSALSVASITISAAAICVFSASRTQSTVNGLADRGWVERQYRLSGRRCFVGTDARVAVRDLTLRFELSIWSSSTIVSSPTPAAPR